MEGREWSFCPFEKKLNRISEKTYEYMLKLEMIGAEVTGFQQRSKKVPMKRKIILKKR